MNLKSKALILKLNVKLFLFKSRRIRDSRPQLLCLFARVGLYGQGGASPTVPAFLLFNVELSYTLHTTLFLYVSSQSSESQVNVNQSVQDLREFVFPVIGAAKNARFFYCGFLKKKSRRDLRSFFPFKRFRETARTFEIAIARDGFARAFAAI